MPERLHVVTNEEMLSASLQGGIIEAHPDDWVMFGAQKSMGLTVITLTDGAARNLPDYSAESLKNQRKAESIRSNRIAGHAQLYAYDLPDGSLEEYTDEATGFVSDVVEDNKLQFLIAPHPRDPHADHEAAARIATLAANDEIPVYYMDTISGKDKYGYAVQPSHYLPLTRNEVRRRKRGYLANESQTQGIPSQEMRDVFSVFDMPKRRGQDIGVPFATSLLKDGSSTTDPLGEILGDQIRIRESVDIFVAR